MAKLSSGKRLNLGIFGALLLMALLVAFFPTGVLASSVTTLTLSPTSIFPGDSVTATWSSTEAATSCTGVIDNADGAGTTTYPLPASGSNGNLRWNVPGTFGVSMFCTNASGIGATVRKTVTVNARASGAYTCTATILTPSVVRGESAKVRVDVSGATEPVYVWAKQQNGWSVLPLMPLYPIVQTIDGCTPDSLLASSCSDPNLFSKVSGSSGSVTINALTNTIHTDLGSQSFNLFCSTNKPLTLAAQGTGPNDAHEVKNFQASYTVVGGSNDCQLTGSRAAGSNTESFLIRPLFNGGSWPPNFSLAKSAAQTFTITNSGTVNATIGANSQSANVTVGLSASTLAPGASAQVTINFNSSASHETFNLTSSCGGSTHTYPLVGEVPFVCTGSCVSPPPPPPPSNPYGVADGDFPILVAGGPLVITEGQTIIRDVVVGNPNGRTAPVKIIAERLSLPPGVNVTFSPSSGTISTGESFHTTATFKADGLLLAGTYKYSLGIDAGFAPSLLYTRNLVMTTKNKVIPAKDLASMPATINTLRTYEAKMLSIRVETPGQTDHPCHPYMCLDEYPSAVGTTFMAVKSWTNPVMILDKAHFTTDMGARYYSLANPMNPVHDSSKDLTLDNRWAGDPGGQTYPTSLAYSRDGEYEVGSQYNQGNKGSTPEYRTNGAFTGIPFEGDAYGGGLVDIFQSNSHVYFTYMNSGGVVRLDGVTKSAPYFNSSGVSVQDWIYPELPDTAPNIPKATGNYPTGSGVHTTVMAGAKDYIAALTGPGDYRSVVAPNKLSIYSAGDSSAVAEIDVKSAATSTGSVQNMASFVTADVQYVMFTVPLPQLPVSPTLTVFDPRRGQNQLFVYKFDPKTSALTKVVEGKLIAGEIGGGLTHQSMAGIRVGNKDGVIMLLHDDPAKDDPNTSHPGYSPIPFQKLKIFMFSDLAAGNLKDVYADAGYSISTQLAGSEGQAASLASLNEGVSTYVYLNTVSYGNPSYGIAVLRFGPSGVNVAPVTPSPNPTQHLACVSNACTLVDGAGTDSCSADADCSGSPPSGGTPPGGGGPAGSCDFTITPGLSTIMITKGSSSATFNFKTTKPADPTCGAITVIVPTVTDSSGNRIIYPSSSYVTVLTVVPGNNGVVSLNPSAAPVGTYPINLKASLRGTSRTATVNLIVQ